MPRHWGSTGPGGRDYDVTEEGQTGPVVTYLDEVAPGEGKTITEIFTALRSAGYGDLVDAAVLLRNRQESTRQLMEMKITELKEDQEIKIARDVEILMMYGLGWVSALKTALEERVSAEINRNVERKKLRNRTREKSSKEPIDFSKGDPVALMYGGQPK